MSRIERSFGKNWLAVGSRNGKNSAGKANSMSAMSLRALLRLMIATNWGAAVNLRILTNSAAQRN